MSTGNNSASSASWCPTCLENCSDHPSMCTICGESLILPPSNSSSSSSSSSARTARFHPSITTEQLPVPIGGIEGQEGQEWQTPPPEAMNPQPDQEPQREGASSTSKSYLDSLERITIHANSAILHQATVTVTVLTSTSVSNCDNDNDNNADADANEGSTTTESKKYIFPATISEFKPHPPYSIHGSLHLSQPIKGAGPIIICTDTTTTTTGSKTNPSPTPNPSSPSSPVILYMERGQNTFVQKTANASSIPNVNVQGIICSNNNSTWPYTMKDSTGKGGHLPIVMIQKSDGQILHALLKKKKTIMKKNTNTNTSMTLHTQIEAIKKSNDQNSCIICTDLYNINERIIKLPLCNHFFHERCIMHWLKNHNTCPYCRKDLPLEDKDEEDERRRRNTSTSGYNGTTSSSVSTSNANDTSNSGNDSRQQWETIFG